ncbi:hypothetical protein H7F33_05200 [Pedobacter sp. PAMC26386]|nr:hypothetical protein H7F33_05200 [Pedobacter sp. PAMC26386]
MQYNSLLEILKKTLQKNKAEKLASIGDETFYTIHDLIDLTFHHDDQIGFRAAWVLENVYSRYQERFLPDAEYFLNRFPQQNNLSSRRHYSKILAQMTRKNASLEIKIIIQHYDTGILADTAFLWLIDPKVPVATKSHCLNVLANLNTKHSWIKEELTQTMDFLIDKESVGFYSKVRQIRKQLLNT